MTDLKKVPTPASTDKSDVTYLWTRTHRRPKKTSERRAPAAEKSLPDPMTIPWGDIVETPLRVFRRLFNRG